MNEHYVMPGDVHGTRETGRPGPNLEYLQNLKHVLRNDADMSECRNILRQGSHSFFAASLLLPAGYRRPITALYAFCRVADDEIDVADDPLQGLRGLRDRLSRLYRGRPSEQPVDRAFSQVVRQYGIPFALPAALLEGFEWDVRGRRYRTLSETYDYCARVAGTVGAMMALLMGVRDAEVLSRACDLGVAMQLTNIARDVGEDARAGRLYLPEDTLRANGVSPDDWMQSPSPCSGIRVAVAELLQVAERLYRRSEWGICQLPVALRPGMFAARAIYADIGREIARRGFDSVSQRSVVPTGRKISLLATALKRSFKESAYEYAPPLSANRFLVDAVSVSRAAAG